MLIFLWKCPLKAHAKEYTEQQVLQLVLQKGSLKDIFEGGLASIPFVVPWMLPSGYIHYLDDCNRYLGGLCRYLDD